MMLHVGQSLCWRAGSPCGHVKPRMSVPSDRADPLPVRHWCCSCRRRVGSRFSCSGAVCLDHSDHAPILSSRAKYPHTHALKLRPNFTNAATNAETGVVDLRLVCTALNMDTVLAEVSSRQRCSPRPPCTRAAPRNDKPPFREHARLVRLPIYSSEVPAPLKGHCVPVEWPVTDPHTLQGRLRLVLAPLSLVSSRDLAETFSPQLPSWVSVCCFSSAAAGASWSLSVAPLSKSLSWVCARGSSARTAAGALSRGSDSLDVLPLDRAVAAAVHVRALCPEFLHREHTCGVRLGLRGQCARE